MKYLLTIALLIVSNSAMSYDNQIADGIYESNRIATQQLHQEQAADMQQRGEQFMRDNEGSILNNPSFGNASQDDGLSTQQRLDAVIGR